MKSIPSRVSAKSSLIRFFIIVALVATVFIVHSCRKEIRLGSYQTATLSDDALSTLKDIFANGIVAGNGFVTQSVNTPQPKIIRNNNVKWDKYVINNRDDNSQVVEFDMQADTVLLTLGNPLQHQKILSDMQIKHALYLLN